MRMREGVRSGEACPDQLCQGGGAYTNMAGAREGQFDGRGDRVCVRGLPRRGLLALRERQPLRWGDRRASQSVTRTEARA
jgi:hypothetical protein